jgi:ribosomal protein S18 acetylase RimI-like enzyme
MKCDATEPCIRPLSAGDTEALLRFYQRLSAETVLFYDPHPGATLETMQDVVRRAVSGEDVARVLVTASGEIVGHVFLRDIASAEPSFGIGIAEDWQNRGYGPKLTAEVLAVADARSEVQAVVLTVNKRNLRAQKLYRDFGFVVYGECDHREPRDSYRMRRPKGG